MFKRRAETRPDDVQVDLPVAQGVPISPAVFAMTEKDKERGGDQKLVAPPDFNGPVANRKTTDILFLIAMVATWVGMTAIGWFGIENGNVWRVINGVDYEGKICGHDTEVEDMNYLYFVNFNGDGVCLESCPSETDLDTLICMDDADIPDDVDTTDVAQMYNDGEGYCMYQYSTTNVLNYCIFNDEDLIASFTSAYTDYFEEFISTMYVAYPYVLGFGVLGSLIFGFLYTFLMRIPGIVQLLVWTSVLTVTTLIIAIGVGMIYTASEWSDENPQSHEDYEITGLRVVGYGILAFSAFWVCLIVGLRSRIALANGIVREAARALARMPLLVGFPVFQVLGFIAFFAPWFIYTLYLISTGEVNTVVNDDGFEYKSFSFSQEAEQMAWFLLFTLFWTSAYITAIGQIVIAMCFAKWYFTRDKVTISSAVVPYAVCTSFRYHLGTAAFGALIIAIVKIIRAAILYVQKTAMRYSNRVAQMVLSCIQCFLWCMEKCLKFLNKHAYIQTAIFGTSFCTSARNGFFLLLRNIARIGTVSLVSEFILIVQRLFISLAAAAGAYYTMLFTIEDEVASLVAPTIFTFIFAWFVAVMFTGIFGMGISTILQCFIADEEMYQGDDRFAEKSLKTWIAKHGRATTPASPGLTKAAPRF